MDVLTAEPQVAGSLLGFKFKVPDGVVEIDGHGQIAWANPNGQTGVHFLDLAEAKVAELRNWLKAAAVVFGTVPDETVPHCKLSDLSLGGCYVQTEAPFPEGSLIDFCLKANDIEVHADGMVRVTHPGYGMGVEFPSRTEEQRGQVENVINFLRSCPGTTPDLSISPKALVADLAQFESSKQSTGSEEELEDHLLELVRRGASLQQDEFLVELQHQRNPQATASA